MNEDIKILREALTELDSALKNPGLGSSLSHDMEVLRSRRDASRALAELCTADRIRRILDDAERYQLVRQGRHWSVVNWCGDTLIADVLDFNIDLKRYA